jgi:hypothetical protein
MGRARAGDGESAGGRWGERGRAMGRARARRRLGAPPPAPCSDMCSRCESADVVRGGGRASTCSGESAAQLRAGGGWTRLARSPLTGTRRAVPPALESGVSLKLYPAALPIPAVFCVGRPRSGDRDVRQRIDLGCSDLEISPLQILGRVRRLRRVYCPRRRSRASGEGSTPDEPRGRANSARHAPARCVSPWRAPMARRPGRLTWRGSCASSGGPSRERSS